MTVFDVYVWNEPHGRLVIQYQDTARDKATVVQRAIHRAKIWNKNERRPEMKAKLITVDDTSEVVEPEPEGLPLFEQEEQ